MKVINTCVKILSQPLERDTVDEIVSAMMHNTHVTKLEMCYCAIIDDSIEVNHIHVY